jgi:hypothetical protein
MNQQPSGLQVQVRALYRSLLASQSRFDEFKGMLARYPEQLVSRNEPEPAARVRAELNARIAGWTGGKFDGLSSDQLLQWRAIVLDEPGQPTDYEATDASDCRGRSSLERHAG